MHNCKYMVWRYLKRSLEPILKRAAAEFPGVVLTGPRQSGKTTLLKHLFGETHGYVSLELPDVRSAAAADPRGFLELHSPPVILEEVQYAPDLLPYIKEAIDARRQERGLYLLTGSQNLLLMARVTESLAGRAIRGTVKSLLAAENAALKKIVQYCAGVSQNNFLTAHFDCRIFIHNINHGAEASQIFTENR